MKDVYNMKKTQVNARQNCHITDIIPLSYLEQPSKALSILHSSKRIFRISKYGANRT